MDERPDVSERSSEDIEREIVATREAISDTVDRIGDRLHEVTDWRAYVSRNPWVALSLAAMAGVFVGRLLAGRADVRSRRSPYPPVPEP